MAGLLTLIGSLDGMLLAAAFIEQNLLLIIGLVIVIIVMFGISWLLLNMTRVVLVVGLVIASIAVIPLWIWLANIELKPIDAAITAPTSAEMVTMKSTIRGKVSDPNAQVHVLIHPLATQETWVQQSPIVGRDGTWQTAVFFGTPTLGIDEDYEIIVLATRENFIINFVTGNSLKPGQVLTQLPERTNKSQVITVHRIK